MDKDRFIKLTGALLLMALTACAGPWISLAPEETVHTFLDIHAATLHTDTDKYKGEVFEDRFKFYRIYHGKERADTAGREQAVRGKTHFTARIVKQHTQVVRIRISPKQEEWIRSKGISRQDVIHARVRFAGIAPDGSLAFDLMEIFE